MKKTGLFFILIFALLTSFHAYSSKKKNNKTVNNKTLYKNFKNGFRSKEESVPKHLIELKRILRSVSSTSSFEEKKVVDYLPTNYVKDGSVDYTEYIQKALNENAHVVFPSFPLLVNENGLTLKSNQTLEFSENSLLIMKPNNLERNALLNLININHVTIKKPKLLGDRSQHTGSKGEWGMGIQILSSSNITILNPVISDFWGDGIYIGEIDHNLKNYTKYDPKEYFSKNIKISGGVIDNNRRNGISVISVKNLEISDITIKNTNGTLPMAGIDLEPNTNKQFLENILIKNVVAKNNKKYGITYSPNHFYGSNEKNVSIDIKNCEVYNSHSGIYLGGKLATNKSKNISKMGGYIKVKNCSLYSNEISVRNGSIQRYNPSISVQKIKVFEKNKRDKSKEQKIKTTLKKYNIKYKE